MSVVSKKETSELQKLLVEFLKREDPTTMPKPRDLQTLRSFLRSNVKRDMAADLDYLERDLVDRLELIRRIRKICLAKDKDTYEEDREALSRATLWSLLLVLDIARLRKIASDLEEGDDAREDTIFRLAGALTGVHDMVWYFTKGPITEWEKEEMINRNASLARAVLERDGMHCVLTGHKNPEVCHIWPFWAVNRKGQADKSLKALASVFGRERINNLRKKLANRESNTVDTPGNMITLNRPLHRFWEEGYFALEPIGPVFKTAHTSTTSSTVEEDTATETSTPTDGAKNDPPKSLRKRASDRLREKIEERDAKRATMQIEGVKIRFHWLRRTAHESMHTIIGPNAELNPRKMWKDWKDKIVVHDVDGRPLENGHILEIFPTSQAEAPDMDILQLQWDILRMHALTGGADPVLYAPDDDYDEDGRMVSVDRPEKVRALEALKDNRAELVAERPVDTARDGGCASDEHSLQNRLSSVAAIVQGGGVEQTMLPFRPRPGTKVLGEITNVATTRVATRMSEDNAVGGENQDPAQAEANH
ncbi:hypothetical protein CSHISOI_03202 [Colletotrichum shisoi]|uniref:HNH nuclease domain-containing protein n=1 Tax=Colletotrichum shisoi TaxID=2078593 RepID=A0A5Q4BYU3_9PEZI|nr:hypothetical protein CSHISOI_03202 [Colletotrichum shisoi]